LAYEYKYDYRPKKRKTAYVAKLRTLKFRTLTKLKAHFKLKLILLACIVIGLIAVAVFLAVYYIYPMMNPAMSGSNNPFIVIPELFTSGYKQVSVSGGVIGTEGVIMLTAGCQQIVAYTEPYQAESILRGLEHIAEERPNAHDITADAFNSLGIEVLMVKVNELRNNTFYGKIIVKNGNTIASLDAKPSDATAIAVRMNAPVYVKDELLQTYGEKIC